MKLILWDIDGTILLVREGLSDELFEQMCEDVYGRSVSLATFRYGGKTDRAIIHEVAQLAGVEEDEVESGLPRAMDYIVAGLEARLSEEDITLLPNIRELIEIFDARTDTVQGLLTGNLPGCAGAKLRPFGLERYFKFGVYGIESRDRTHLGPIALERAIEHMPAPPAPKDVIIIGDSVRDVECAHTIGATSIITLTGRTTREELAPYQPDHIVNDLSDTHEILRLIYG